MVSNLFGNWLAEQQKRRKLGDTKLAAHLGVTAPTISRWKSGKWLPRDPAQLDLIAEFFGEDRTKVYFMAGRGQIGMDVDDLLPEMAQLAYEIQNHLETIADPSVRAFAQQDLRQLVATWIDRQEHIDELLESIRGLSTPSTPQSGSSKDE